MSKLHLPRPRLETNDISLRAPALEQIKWYISSLIYLGNYKVREYILKHYPDRKVAPLSKEAEKENPQQTFDASKAARTFGINFRTLDDILRDYTDFVFSFKSMEIEVVCIE